MNCSALPLVCGPLWPGPLVADLDLLDRPGVCLTRVGPGVVGQNPLDADAVAGEPDRRVEEGPAGAAGALVADVGDIRQPGGVVDHHLDVVVAELAVTAVACRLARPRIRWPPPSGIRPSFLWSWWTSEPG